MKNILAENMRRFNTKNLNENLTDLDTQYLNTLITDPSAAMLPSVWMSKKLIQDLSSGEAGRGKFNIGTLDQESIQTFGVGLVKLLSALDTIKLKKLSKAPELSAVVHDQGADYATRAGKKNAVSTEPITRMELSKLRKNASFIEMFPSAKPADSYDTPMGM